MLATPELIREAAQPARLEELLPHWRKAPLYRTRLSRAGVPPTARDNFFHLPFLTKREMREDFPRNFLPSAEALESLLRQNLVEVEHTSGTSEERAPVVFRRAGGTSRRSVRCG